MSWTKVSVEDIAQEIESDPKFFPASSSSHKKERRQIPILWPYWIPTVQNDVHPIGFHSYDLSLARSRAETIIAAADRYHQDKGAYPANLQQLVPAYLADIPQPRIVPGRFYYLGGPESPHLMYVEFPPFGRVSWSFVEREWITID